MGWKSSWLFPSENLSVVPKLSSLAQSQHHGSGFGFVFFLIATVINPKVKSGGCGYMSFEDFCVKMTMFS